MANREFSPVKSYFGEETILEGLFSPNGTSAPLTGSPASVAPVGAFTGSTTLLPDSRGRNGGIWSVARTGVGSFTVTFRDPFNFAGPPIVDLIGAPGTPTVPASGAIYEALCTSYMPFQAAPSNTGVYSSGTMNIQTVWASGSNTGIPVDLTINQGMVTFLVTAANSVAR